MITLYNKNIDWTHYLTRPFSLFGASLWQSWYDSKEIKELIGASTPDALFVEENQDVVRYYREKKQLSNMREAIERIVREEPERLRSIFKKGFELNDQAEQAIAKGPDAYENLEVAVHAIIELALHATVVPNFSLVFIDALKIKDTSLREMAEKLRGISYYPRFNSQIVIPHVTKILEKTGIDTSLTPLVTLKELKEMDFVELQERLIARKKGRRFIYELSAENEHIGWIDDPMVVVRKLEHIPLENNGKELRGQIAFKGKARGTARVVLRDDLSGIMFDEGDILVSINSSPVLMPLIQKCAAIVTDEGGVACHAAIVSRELKKPCIIGTKIATKVLKDGDLIEVDANAGVVTILESKT